MVHPVPPDSFKLQSNTYRSSTSTISELYDTAVLVRCAVILLIVIIPTSYVEYNTLSKIQLYLYHSSTGSSSTKGNSTAHYTQHKSITTGKIIECRVLLSYPVGYVRYYYQKSIRTIILCMVLWYIVVYVRVVR